jgi:hypothetical protein
MTVRLTGNVILLEGECRVEDAEPLLALLQANGDRIVDLAGTSRLHTAVVQVLLALSPETVGTSADPFIRDWIAPLLTRTHGGLKGPPPQRV